MPVKAAKMGGCSSSQEVQTVHSQLPVDQVPYQGPALQYAFVNVNTQMKSHLTFGFSQGENVVTSNVDEYYPYLAQNYNEGFKLIQFLKIPFNQSKDGVFSMSFNVPYQGIYCRKNAGQPEPNSWQLKIEKAMIHMQRLAGGLLFSPRQGLTHSQSDLAHMFHLIQTNASAGGRFVCMEQTGMVQSQGMSMAMSGVSPGMGTDLFFNMPLHPNPVLYTYMAISVPVPLLVSYGFGGGFTMNFNWMGNLAHYLNQGWKLADIYMDDIQMLLQMSRRRRRDRHAGPSMMPRSLNSVWFFEKELNRLDEATPIYEGTIVEYKARVSAGFGGIMSSDFNITQLCQEMGNKGWKLTCFIQTPNMSRAGFTSATVTSYLFFQRRILGQTVPPATFGVGMPVGNATGHQQPPPPAYDSAALQKS